MGDDPLLCFVEIPKGSRNKYEYDHDAGAIKLDRFLFSSMVYPTDYGFIPDTLGLDEDPLDAMVCVSEPTFPGCIIEVKAIALFRMEDDKGVDDKVLCVPLQDPSWNTLEELDDLPDQLRKEIAHFFSVYKDLEQKKVKVDGWYSREDALKEIEQARKRCAEHRDGGGEGRDALEGAEPIERIGSSGGNGERPSGEGGHEPEGRGS
jgi:inorganic pyrophosphatase